MPTQRGSATSATSANGTSVTANKPAGVVAGDLLLAVFTNNNQTVTRPSGWNQLFYANASGTTGNSWSTGMYWKVAGSEEPASFQFKVPSAAPLVLTLSAWANVDTVTPIGSDFVSYISGSHAEPRTGQAKTVTAANGRLLYVRAVRFAGTAVPTFTASGVTEVVDKGVFSGGSVSYASVQYCETSDYSGAGSKPGLAITCSQAESDNCEVTLALRTKATPASGAFASVLPSVAASDFEVGAHFDADIDAGLPSVTSVMDGLGSPIESSGDFAGTLGAVSAEAVGAVAARGTLHAVVLPRLMLSTETRVFGVRVIAVEEDLSRLIVVPSRGVDD
ncbi:hypothetical protein ACWD2L_05915 [Streptomyces sp. NPDC002754]